MYLTQQSPDTVLIREVMRETGTVVAVVSLTVVGPNELVQVAYLLTIPISRVPWCPKSWTPKDT